MSADKPSACATSGAASSAHRPAARRQRFYTSARAAPAPVDAGAPGHWRLLLDGRTARSPGSRVLDLPTEALALAVAAEWDAQTETIDPAAMPLTRLVNTVLDGVAGREAEVAADVVRYAGSDLVCYRAEGPEGLLARQVAQWDPLVDWAEVLIGVRPMIATGLLPIEQPAVMSERLGDVLSGWDAWRLAALHIMTTLTGSALISLACATGQLTAAEAWQAAHVDEDWQIGLWGEDAEAAQRRSRRWLDMQAARRLLDLLGVLPA